MKYTLGRIWKEAWERKQETQQLSQLESCQVTGNAGNQLGMRHFSGEENCRGSQEEKWAVWAGEARGPPELEISGGRASSFWVCVHAHGYMSCVWLA